MDSTTPNYDASDTDPHHTNHSQQGENVDRTRSGQRLSFEQQSLTSDSGGGSGGGGVRQRSFSQAFQGGIEVQASGRDWESRDLSRRANIHRSHLSSSI